MSVVADETHAMLADWEARDGPRPPEFAVGDRVVHAKFGAGTVSAIDDDVLAIEFDEAGAKRIRADRVERAVGCPPEFSEEALALAYAGRHAGGLRHVAKWGRWLFWDGRCWRDDDTLLAFNHSREICREAAEICRERRLAGAIASAKSVAAVERLARADRRLAARVDQWDADAWLLNTPGGAVDLRTGKIRPSDPGDYLTKITAVAPDESCPILVWMKFLDDVTAGDTELSAFLQRMVGYALTGVTREHAFFFCYGTGGNGKGTFIDTITGCVGDYHRAAAIETFTLTNMNRHPTELASLRGARVVTATETEEGRRWAESKLKLLTGGDKITAYFMRQDPFDYKPQFKLVFEGNHKPGLRSVDEAIRRRLHLVPFTVTIPEEARDPTLRERLKAEWPGVLAWAIKGCLEWQRIGLVPPAAVRAATASYLEAEDAVAAWLEDCCERDLQGWEPIADLYASWRPWAEKSGVYAGSKVGLGEKLDGKGFAPKRQPGTGTRGHCGLRLKPKHGADGNPTALADDDDVPY
jgi:putative DNA primase/helicase